MKTLGIEHLADFRKGNHETFEKIFEIYGEPVYHFSYNYLKSKEAAEDIVQEVFLKIWTHRQDIKNNASFQSYLFTIALNSIRKSFNKLNRTNEMKHEILKDLSGQKDDFDDRLNYQDLMDKLHELIKRMPDKRRQVFIKKKIEDKSLKEIAEELGIDTKTVEYHITEGMKFLKQEFEKLKLNGLIFFHLFLSKKSF